MNKEQLKEQIISTLIEMSSQDNRSTAFPYYYQIAYEKPIYEYSRYGDYVYQTDYGMRKISDILSELNDNNELSIPEDIEYETLISEIGSICEETTFIESVLKSLDIDPDRRYDMDEETIYEGFFLTESDAETYLQKARHHFPKTARTYVQYLNRWRDTQTGDFFNNLFKYFDIPIPPKMFYEKEEKELCKQ